MTNKQSLLLFAALLLTSIINAQTQWGFSPVETKERLQSDILFLSSDELEGREAGTAGEMKAAEYIRDEMIESGLEPMFGTSYFQDFEFPGEWLLGENNILVIKDESFTLHQDYFVLPNSKSASLHNQAVYVGFGWANENHNDYSDLSQLEGKIFFMEYHLPPNVDDNSGRQTLEVMQQKVETALQKGASAIIFVNTQSEKADPPTSLNQRLGKEEIPILFARNHVFEYWQQIESNTEIVLTVDLARESFTAYNVAGIIDNKAEHTVVFGAHYDHLGYGGMGSRSPGINEIHPGADDNASGTAGILEMARYLSQSDLTSQNYIFVAFSAEEKGLIGSRYFASSDFYNKEQVSYMFNFDMLGRVEDSNITLYGTGTSPLWDSVIDFYTPEDLTIRKSPSGMGSSDHTNFYRENIPVLFFFSGLHDDYHRPSDTEDKINYEGMLSILGFATDMVKGLSDSGKLPFTETSMPERQTARRQGPTLGIMPDHAFDGEGLRIQGVSENNPAQKAGLKGGDVIIRIGETKISDIYTYMKAMGGLKNVNSVMVRILRDETELDMNVILR
jgi:hypothetical protein